MSMYMYMRAYVYVNAYANVYAYVGVHVNLYVYVDVHVHMHVYMCMCVHMYVICVCIHTNLNIILMFAIILSTPSNPLTWSKNNPPSNLSDFINLV